MAETRDVSKKSDGVPL